MLYYCETLDDDASSPSMEFDSDAEAIKFFMREFDNVMAVIRDNDPEIVAVWEYFVG